MSNLMSPYMIQFKNGEPHFEYNDCYNCFKDRDLLYRLVNTKNKQWAFYNDSTDTMVRVHASFGADSNIQALERTRLVKLPTATEKHDKDGSRNKKEFGWEAFLEVEPGFTELFIEGTAIDFLMDFHCEAAPAKNVVFENCAPTVAYDKIYKCFKENGNGLLFRLVNEKQATWAFHNDTKEYVMKVTVDFENKGEITPLGTAKVSETPSSNSDGIVYNLLIPPCKTEMFILGIPSVYRLSFVADPIVVEREEAKDIHYKNGHPDSSIIHNMSHVYKCFKEHENGLLFRIVDDKNHIWVFYNDTKDYTMTVNARFPPGELLQAAHGVETMQDEEIEGGVILAVRVPPLTTVPFIHGIPEHFELAFSAELANKSIPEAMPHYENGAPNPVVIQPDEVYKCFKDHKNGLLFRLVDLKNRRWAFYNDTKDTIMHVKASFNSLSKVTALGKTKLDTDPEMGAVYVLEISPLRTELFVEGEVDSFKTCFTASKMQVNLPEAIKDSAPL